MFDGIRHQAYGLALLVVIAGLVGLTAAMYNDSFAERVSVTVQTERVGLLLYERNSVKFRGVKVGEVTAATRTPDGRAQLTLGLKPEAVDTIPSNVRVRLAQLTAFGRKVVQLEAPARPSSSPVRAGSRFRADQVTVEVNNLFERLVAVLDVAKPAAVNGALTALSDSLEGRGAKLGRTLVATGDYLGELNPRLPAVERDLGTARSVANLYADVTPELARILGNLGMTSRTITAERRQLDTTLREVSGLAREGTSFLQIIRNPLVRVLQTTRPTTGLLARYSPQLTCFLRGYDRANELMQPTWGGKVPGVLANVSVVPGEEMYRYPEDVPELRADRGPNCYGLPNITKEDRGDSLLLPVDSGVEPNPAGPDVNSYEIGDPPLVVELFGPLGATETGETGGNR